MSYLVAAYAVLWIGLFAYLIRLGARLRRVRGELAALSDEPSPGHGRAME
jgi:CcmD family protein